MRALGRCWKVLIVMFTKGEMITAGRILSASFHLKYQKIYLKSFKPDLIESYIKTIKMTRQRRNKKGWEIAKQAIQNHEYQAYNPDEANIAIDLGILDVDEVVDVLKKQTR